MDSDMPWIPELSKEEIQQLRNNKQQLTDYGMRKIRELMRNQEPYPDAMFEEAERREAANNALSTNIEITQNTEKPFYRYFVVDYFATGEGRSIWLKICRNYQSYDGRDREKEKWEKFVGHEHYLQISEEQTEKEFMERYTKLIPENVKLMVERRDQPVFNWETHYHFNYS